MRAAGTSSTALRVTSDPVPAVVGIATNGRARHGERQPLADHLEVLQRVAAVGGEGGDRLAGVDRRPAADGDHHVVAAAPGQVGASGREVDVGLAVDAQQPAVVSACLQRRDEPLGAGGSLPVTTSGPAAEAAHDVGRLP